MLLPKISVITPSFNQVRFIEKTILSVLNQNYSNIEHIIIDGGSTDGTIEILKRYPHLRWISEPDCGQTHALNKGFKMATGDIIGWLNSDDTYCPDIFTTIVKQFAEENVKVVCGDGYEIDDKGNVTRQLYSHGTSPAILIRFWKWQYEFVQPAFFFRRDVFNEVGYLDESLYYTMDYDFFIRLGKRYEFHHVCKPLAIYRLYSESKTGKNFMKFIPDYMWEMQKVSHRYWGTPLSLRYYNYLLSFFGAIFYSVIKNVFFTPTSKSRAAVKRLFNRGEIQSNES